MNTSLHSGGPVGLLLMNVGTPAAPTPQAVRPYLREFLSDPRVVDYPRWLWLPLLYGVILVTRPRRSARLYQNVWTREGSPLWTILQAQAAALAAALAQDGRRPVIVAAGLRYGRPAIAEALQSLHAQGVRRVLALPMYPQYSGTTTGASFDALFAALQRQPEMVELRTLTGYHTHPGYIQALVNSIQTSFARHGEPDRLLFSYHGIPQRYAQNGDPYPEFCRETTEQVVQALGLPKERWALSFQSRFGPEKWLQPYTDETLEHWGQSGVKHVQVIAPGFSADCLETLDELGREGRDSFIEAGGQTFHYIPALNTSAEHIHALVDLVRPALAGWR